MEIKVENLGIEIGNSTLWLIDAVIDVELNYDARDVKVFGVGSDPDIQSIVASEIELNYTMADDEEEQFTYFDKFTELPEDI